MPHCSGELASSAANHVACVGVVSAAAILLGVSDPFPCCPPRRLSPAEASFMDPQSRILLEQTHLALLGAGSRREAAVPADTGV